MLNDHGGSGLRIVVSLPAGHMRVGDDCLIEWPEGNTCSGRLVSLVSAFPAESAEPKIGQETDPAAQPGRLALMEIDLSAAELSRVKTGGHASQVLVSDAAGQRPAISGLAIPSSIDQNLAISPGLAIWFTGFSGAGKTTIAQALERELCREGRVEMLDADVVRTHICKGLGFSKADRTENLLRLAFVAKLLVETGAIVLVSAISPYAAARKRARSMIPRFVEVYVNAPISVCAGRDVKGLYRKAREGKLQLLTGVDDPYEPPIAPEIECLTEIETPEESVTKIIQHIRPILTAVPTA